MSGFLSDETRLGKQYEVKAPRGGGKHNLLDGASEATRSFC